MYVYKLLNFLYESGLRIYKAFSGFWEIVSTPLEVLVEEDIPSILVSPLFRLLAENTALGTYSLADIFFGNLLIFFVVVSIIKWVIGIIL